MRDARPPLPALLLTSAFAATLVHATAAYASEPTASELQAARALFAAAERDEDAGRWDAAAEKLRKVATVKATPGIRFHLGLCAENLGHLVVALAEYTAAESLATRERNREVLESVRGPLAQLRERVPELTIQPPADAPAAEIVLDGRTLPGGLLGVAMPLDPGAHTVAARAPGRVAFTRTVTLVERDRSTLDVTLAPLPPPAPPLAQTGPGPEALQPLPARGSTGRSRVPAVVATVGAVALAGAGVALFVLAGDEHAGTIAECGGACTDGEKAPTRRLDALALGSWIGAGALGVLSVSLWTRGGAPTAALVPLPGGGALRGTF